MHRIFIAAVSAAALVITGFAATPARADGNDVAKALAGIAALALIAKAIDDRNDRKAARQQHYTHRQLPPRYQHQPGYRHQPGLQPRPLPPQASRRGLPEHCLQVANTVNGPARVFSARCLQRNYAEADHLPRSCAQEVWTDRGYRWAYDAGCLHHKGYRIAYR